MTSWALSVSSAMRRVCLESMWPQQAPEAGTVQSKQAVSAAISERPLGYYFGPKFLIINA